MTAPLARPVKSARVRTGLAAGTKPASYDRAVRFVFAPLAPSPNDK